MCYYKQQKFCVPQVWQIEGYIHQSADSSNIITVSSLATTGWSQVEHYFEQKSDGYGFEVPQVQSWIIFPFSNFSNTLS